MAYSNFTAELLRSLRHFSATDRSDVLRDCGAGGGTGANALLRPPPSISPLLILKGPPGSGKASVLHALCSEGFELVEWTSASRKGRQELEVFVRSRRKELVLPPLARRYQELLHSSVRRFNLSAEALPSLEGWSHTRWKVVNSEEPARLPKLSLAETWRNFHGPNCSGLRLRLWAALLCCTAAERAVQADPGPVDRYLAFEGTLRRLRSLRRYLRIDLKRYLRRRSFPREASPNAGDECLAFWSCRFCGGLLACSDGGMVHRSQGPQTLILLCSKTLISKSAEVAAESLFILLGIDYAREGKKAVEWGTRVMKTLGVMLDLAPEGAHGSHVKLDAHRDKDRRAQAGLGWISLFGKMSRKDAEKLRGRLQ
eukprot:s122_g35.t1